MDVVGRWTKHHTKAELFELGQAMRFPWAPVDSPQEVLKSPQLAARQFFIQRELAGTDRTFLFPGPPYKSSTFSPPSLQTAPLRGEHTIQILEELEVSWGMIDELSKKKVI